MNESVRIKKKRNYPGNLQSVNTIINELRKISSEFLELFGMSAKHVPFKSKQYTLMHKACAESKTFLMKRKTSLLNLNIK